MTLRCGQKVALLRAGKFEGAIGERIGIVQHVDRTCVLVQFFGVHEPLSCVHVDALIPADAIVSAA